VDDVVLECWKELDPAVVRRVQTLVDHGGARRGPSSEFEVLRVTRHDLNAVGNLGTTGPADRSDLHRPRRKLIHEGEADIASAEHAIDAIPTGLPPT
jgi:hypothetical protein